MFPVVMERSRDDAAPSRRFTEAHREEAVRISDEKKKQIIRLIKQGESLTIQDSQAFQNWMRDSHEALEFHPLQKERFDRYCRFSCDSDSTRLYVGVWMLRLAVED